MKLEQELRKKDCNWIMMQVVARGKKSRVKYFGFMDKIIKKYPACKSKIYTLERMNYAYEDLIEYETNKNN